MYHDLVSGLDGVIGRKIDFCHVGCLLKCMSCTLEAITCFHAIATTRLQRFIIKLRDAPSSENHAESAKYSVHY